MSVRRLRGHQASFNRRYDQRTFAHELLTDGIGALKESAAAQTISAVTVPQIASSAKWAGPEIGIALRRMRAATRHQRYDEMTAAPLPASHDAGASDASYKPVIREPRRRAYWQLRQGGLKLLAKTIY
jgi:hypothetical protein